ncbi:MAG: hypothetical protein PHS44_02345 [Candidatus Dojkabacteria bacterium]|jgi:hypothetical protein|nr:hypothetical protein [Candidatus Dojkabacteria bacterium]
MSRSIYNYIGNGAYCYANSTAMLLDSIGEDIDPALIEVLTGMSLGLKWNKEDNLMLFHNHPTLPDLGITKALEFLGFSCEMKVSENKDDFPIDDLRKDLEKSPAVMGPLDMGYLKYNPKYKYLKGADHYILGYRIEDDRLYLHDPECFPHVFINLDDLKQSWQANGISYKKGFYRYIVNLKRVDSPALNEVFEKAIKFMKYNYIQAGKVPQNDKFELGSKGLINYARRLRKYGLKDGEAKWYVNFALPLGAKRSNDYARYFKKFDIVLSELKYSQSRLFGSLHCYAMSQDWDNMSRGFEELARVENDFREKLMINY